MGHNEAGQVNRHTPYHPLPATAPIANVPADLVIPLTGPETTAHHK